MADPVGGRNRSSLLCVVPYVLFFASGGCSLVYEVIWARYLGLIIGNTTLAHVAVLSTFMAGLALGSLLVGRSSDRLRRPLRTYGFLEIGIAALAVSFPYVVKPATNALLWIGAGIEFGSWQSAAIRVTLATALLVTPTFLMGGTFPLLVRHLLLCSDEDKSQWVYTANCAGAVLGVCAAGFILIPAVGMRASLYAAGALNALLGLLAVMLASLPHNTRDAIASLGPVDGSSAVSTARPCILAAICLSGAAAMVYELVWIRLFAVTLGSTTYSFTLMLAAMITGLALGSLLVGISRRPAARPLASLGAAEIVAGLAVAATLGFYERLPWLFWKWSSVLHTMCRGFAVYSALKYSLCFLVMLVPATASGAAIPLAIKAGRLTSRDAGYQAGSVYGWNTFGAVAGTLLCGLVLIPLFGLQSSMELGVVLNVTAATLVLWVVSRRARLAAVGVWLAAAVALLAAPVWNPAHLAYGFFRQHFSPPGTWSDFRRMCSRTEVLYSGEDATNRVAVVITDLPMVGRDVVIVLDGKAEASGGRDAPTQVLLGQLPMMLKPDAREVLMTGLGTGISAASVLTHPQARVDLAEISYAVTRAALCLDEVNRGLLDNPRFHLIVEDGRFVAAANRKRYDVIVCDPSFSWAAGSGNLFSLEFYRQLDRILVDDGILVQWSHTYEMSDELIRMLIRTMRAVFPFVYVYQGVAMDCILVGSRRPVEPDWAAMKKRMRVEAVRSDLDRISIDSPEALVALRMLSSESAKRLAGSGSLNTDDRPILEFEAPRSLFYASRSAILDRADERIHGFPDGFIASHIRLDERVCESLVRLFDDPRYGQPGLRDAVLNYWRLKYSAR